MSFSKLKLNPDKTECLVFGSKAYHKRPSSHFHHADTVRNLGMWFEADFFFTEHVLKTFKVYFLQIHDCHCIREHLPMK